MNFPIHLFRPKADLPTPIACAIDAWRVLPAPTDDTPLDEARFVVLDVMSDSFDARRGHLLGFGAVAIERRRVLPGEALSVVLPVPETTETAAAEEALAEFLAFAGKAPCVALHAAFAQTVLDRALRAELGVQTLNPWIDLARLVPALCPELPRRSGGVDNWLRELGLHVLLRDNPLHDSHVAAKLLLMLLERAVAGGITTLGALREMAREPERIATGAR